jgi:hypothetical protein
MRRVRVSSRGLVSVVVPVSGALLFSVMATSSKRLAASEPATGADADARAGAGELTRKERI